MHYYKLQYITIERLFYCYLAFFRNEYARIILYTVAIMHAKVLLNKKIKLVNDSGMI